MNFKKVILLVMVITMSLNAFSAGSPSAKKGGTFYFNLSNAPTTINPLSSTDGFAQTVQSYVMDSLLDRDSDTYEWLPALATAWKTSADGLQIEFTIRDGVKWHDGKPLTVEDIKFSYDAIMHPTDKYKTAHLKSYYENFEKLEIVNKNTIKFYVKTKYFGNFDNAATMTIVPKHIYENPSKEEEKKLNRTLVGSGPYIFSKLDRSKGITLEKNKNWWGNTAKEMAGKYNFDKIFLRFIKDNTIAMQRLEKGDLDYNSMQPEEFEKMTTSKAWGKDVFKVKVKNMSPKGYTFIGWNLNDPIFKSKNVRIAMAKLMNRREMIEKFRFGYSLPATGPLYQQSEFADSNVRPIEYDVKGALEMLRDDGWKDSDGDMILDKVIDGKKVKLSFTILEPSADFAKYLTVFKQDAKKAGVEINVKVIEWNTFVKALDEKNFQAVRLAWGAGGVNWDPKQIWHSSSAENQGSNFISYKNADVDKLIEQSRTQLDKSKRIVTLNKVYKMIAEDAPYLFMFNDEYGFYGHSKRMGKEKDTYKFSVGTSHWWIEK